MLTEKEREVLYAAAQLLNGQHSESVYMTLLGPMLEVASHRLANGVNAHIAWCVSLRALGQICIAVADREQRKYK